MRHSHWRTATGSILILALALNSTSSANAHDATTPMSAGPSQAKFSSEKPFLAENETAMTKMMADMAVKPTGDVDRDFVAMMVPHHQGAIDMAVAVLRYGHNETLKRLAQEIIVTQQQEIAAMHLAVGDPLPASAPAPTQPTLSPTSADRAPRDEMQMGAMQMKMN